MWYPKAEKHPHEKTGGTQQGGSPRGVLHTTETKNWAGSRYYHIEYNPSTHTFRQYRSFAKSAYGLRHPSQTPETNRQGNFCIQLAVTAYAGDVANWDDQTYEDLAEFIQWCNSMFGIDLFSRLYVGHGGEAYGENGTARMLWDQWELLNGWCAHQEVPANTHWDAGKVDWERLLGDEMPHPADALTEAEVARLQQIAGADAVDLTGEGQVFHDDWEWAIEQEIFTQHSQPTDLVSKQEYAAFARRGYRPPGEEAELEVETVEVVTGITTEKVEVVSKVTSN